MAGESPMEGAQVLEFETRSPATYREMLAGDSAPLERIRGFLFLPAGIEKPPLVVVSIGSQGFASGREMLYSSALTAMGIAVFVVDSFTPRGFAETTSSQGRLSMAGSASDALHAIAFMRDDPRIDAARIGILGYSRGGNVAVATNHRGLQQAVLGRPDAIAAHVALYPSLNPRWRNPKPTQAPMLVLLGEADDLALASTIRSHVEALAQNGAPVELVAYPGAHHGFDSIIPASRHAVANLSACRMMIEDDGSVVEEATGIRAGSNWGEFLGQLQVQCGSVGGTVGHGPGPREIAVRKVQDFYAASLTGPG